LKIEEKELDQKEISHLDPVKNFEEKKTNRMKKLS